MSLENKIGDNDAGEVLDSIAASMLEGYAYGAETAVIYTGNQYVHGALTKWHKGWIRKAGQNGIWKNSKGKIINQYNLEEKILDEFETKIRN